METESERLNSRKKNSGYRNERYYAQQLEKIKHTHSRAYKKEIKIYSNYTDVHVGIICNFRFSTCPFIACLIVYFWTAFFLLKYSSCVFICSFVSLAVCVCVCYAVLVSCLDLMKSDWYQIQHVVHAVNRICLFELEKKNSTWIKKYTPNIDDKWFLHMQQHIWAQLIENTNSNKVVWRKMRFIQSFRAQTRNIRTARNTNANIFDEQEQRTEEENCFCFWCFFW